MFEDMPDEIRVRMQELEAIDARDRIDGTPQARRLRQVAPEAGRLLALLAACAPAGRYLEIGTSAGYSTLWIALACRLHRRQLTTFETQSARAAWARETFRVAQVGDVVTLIEGDALAHVPSIADIAFCFLDAEKDIYAPCYQAIVPRLVPGGLLVADNATSHQDILRDFLENALRDPRVDALVVPVGRGELVCRKR